VLRYDTIIQVKELMDVLLRTYYLLGT